VDPTADVGEEEGQGRPQSPNGSPRQQPRNLEGAQAAAADTGEARRARLAALNSRLDEQRERIRLLTTPGRAKGGDGGGGGGDDDDDDDDHRSGSSNSNSNNNNNGNNNKRSTRSNSSNNSNSNNAGAASAAAAPQREADRNVGGGGGGGAVRGEAAAPGDGDLANHHDGGTFFGDNLALV
jgi:hypothetical protein